MKKKGFLPFVNTLFFLGISLFYNSLVHCLVIFSPSFRDTLYQKLLEVRNSTKEQIKGCGKMIDIVSNVRDYLGTVNKVCLHFSSISLILVENYLKTLPDLSICTFVPMEKDQEVIIATLFMLCAGGEQKREAVMKHLYPYGWTIANPCSGLGRGQGEQETGCSSDVGEACWDCSTPPT